MELAGGWQPWRSYCFTLNEDKEWASPLLVGKDSKLTSFSHSLNGSFELVAPTETHVHVGTENGLLGLLVVGKTYHCEEVGDIWAYENAPPPFVLYDIICLPWFTF
jgi:hypothetical protein